MSTTVRTIQITVTESPSNTFRIDVSEDPIDLRGVPGAIRIQWTLAGDASWHFAGGGSGKGSGIAIPDAVPAVFKDDGMVPNNKGYAWTRLKADDRKYKYSIGVTNDKTTLILDPGIINEN